MQLSEVEKLKLQVASLTLQLIQKSINDLLEQGESVKKEGDTVVKEFCDKNKLDVKQVNIDPNTGVVKLIEIPEEKKEENKEA